MAEGRHPSVRMHGSQQAPTSSRGRFPGDGRASGSSTAAEGFPPLLSGPGLAAIVPTSQAAPLARIRPPISRYERVPPGGSTPGPPHTGTAAHTTTAAAVAVPGKVMSARVAVLGGGLSGLAHAHFLRCVSAAVHRVGGVLTAGCWLMQEAIGACCVDHSV